MHFTKLKTSAPKFGAALAASAALLLAAPTAEAELLIGLTTQNSLISFDSATPGTVTPIGSITGLTAGDSLIGIDRRPQGIAMTNLPGPQNGLIYAFGTGGGAAGSARIYTLDEITATATLVSTLAADPADATAPTPFTTVSGTSFGIDFNPTVDRLRVTSNTGQNLRINVNNGLTQLDGPLAYQAGDPNFGDAPVDIAVAYSNNFGNATSTVLRGVDIGQSPDALLVHSNPNGGVLATAFDLPFDSLGLAAYDISGLTGTPYFAVDSAGSGGMSTLFAAGPGGVTAVGTVGGGVGLVGLAAPVGTPIPEPGTGLVGMALAGFIGAARARRRR